MVGRGMLARKGVGEGGNCDRSADPRNTGIGRREVLAKYEKEGAFCSPPFPHDSCGTVEEPVFGPRHDSEKVHGRKKNGASRALATDDREWKRVKESGQGRYGWKSRKYG
jgi:hypothetical protein